MNSVTRSGTGNPITEVKIGNAFPNSNNRSGAAVAQSIGLIETAANRGRRREHTVSPNFIEYFANQIRTGFRLLQQVLATEFTGGTLRASGNQRRRHPYQHASR